MEHNTVPQQSVGSKRYNDCLSCRIVGTGTLAGVGSYAIWQSRAAAPGGPAQKRIVAGLGVGVYHFSCYTLFNPLSAIFFPSFDSRRCREMVPITLPFDYALLP